VLIVHNGKRTSRKAGDKAAAEAAASKIRAKLQGGEFNFEEEKPTPTIKELADSWINITGPATCKESTVDNHTRLLKNHILPVFSDMKITDITRAKIKNFLDGKINNGCAKSTVNNLRAVISDVLNEAADAEVIPANPSHRLGRIGKKEDDNGKIDPLTQSELKKLLDTVQTDKELSSHYPLFLLLARTGVWVGEAIALKWDDLDFNGRFINIERTYSKGRLVSPKNGKSRKVDMSWQLKDALLRLKESKVVVSMDRDSNWIFTNGEGNLIDTDNWRRRVFNKAIKEAGVKRIRIHDLRHTYATIRLPKGDNVVDVVNQLGDYVGVVLKVYSHWMPGKKRVKLTPWMIQNIKKSQMHPICTQQQKRI
jgi:integrase